MTSRLAEKLTLAAGVAKRITDTIEARADALIARESAIDKRTDEVFVPHEGILADAERGLDAAETALRLMSNNPPLEHSTPLPGGPRVLPDGPAGMGDLNLPKADPESIVGDTATMLQTFPPVAKEVEQPAVATFRAAE